MKKIKLGIVGSGFGLYGLLPAFHFIELCNVVAVCGKKSERLLDYCKEIGLNNIYSTWSEMFVKEEIDAVAIAVIPKVQDQIATYAMNRGIHVFAEKPLAVDLIHAQKLFDLASKTKVTNTVDFIFPEIDTWKKVKKILDQEKYGPLLSVDVQWIFESYDIKNSISSWKTNLAEGGGALSFFFSHTLYYLEFFAGKIKDIKSKLHYSKKSHNGGDVGVTLQLLFSNNVHGSALLRSDKKGKNIHKLVFKCKHALIILENCTDSVTNFKLAIHSKGDVILLRDTLEASQKDIDERVFVVKHIAQRFIQSCLSKKQMSPSIKDGLRVQMLIDHIRSQNT